MSIPPPPARNRKGPPPTEADVPGALFTPPADAAPPKAVQTRKRDTPFNFRVEKALSRRFAQRAFDLEVDRVDLLEAMVELYLDDERLAGKLRKNASTP